MAGLAALGTWSSVADRDAPRTTGAADLDLARDRAPGTSNAHFGAWMAALDQVAGINRARPGHVKAVSRSPAPPPRNR